MKSLLTLLVVLATGSCAYCADASTPAAAPAPTGSDATLAPTPSSPAKDYKISPRDTIQFQIYNQLDMTSVQRVTANGEIRLPLVGTVKVADMTLRDAERVLEGLYKGGGYFVSPQVILSIQQYDDRYVAVLGQVKEPARIPLDSETVTLGILHAVTQVGGFTRVAKTDAVQVLRLGPDGQDEKLIINTDTLLQKGVTSATPEFQLQAGDIVFVPERTF